MTKKFYHLIIIISVIMTQEQAQDDSSIKENLIMTKTKMLNNYESALKSIVEIQTIESNGKSSTATGFLIKKEGKIYIATNKHVIGDYELRSVFPFYKKISLVLATISGTTHLLDIPLANDNGNLLTNIKIHPKNYIDVAIIDITELIKNVWTQLSVETFAFEQLISSDQFSNYGISKADVTRDID